MTIYAESWECVEMVPDADDPKVTRPARRSTIERKRYGRIAPSEAAERAAEQWDDDDGGSEDRTIIVLVIGTGEHKANSWTFHVRCETTRAYNARVPIQ